MKHILDLDQYPLDKPGSKAWLELVEKCQTDLEKDGMFNLEVFVKPEALT